MRSEDKKTLFISLGMMLLLVILSYWRAADMERMETMPPPTPEEPSEESSLDPERMMEEMPEEYREIIKDIEQDPEIDPEEYQEMIPEEYEHLLFNDDNGEEEMDPRATPETLPE